MVATVDKADSVNWHSLSADDTLLRLNSSLRGLSSQQAYDRIGDYGKNIVPAKPPPSVLQRFLVQFHNILIYILIVAALITFFMGHYADMAVIIAVVIANAIIGFIQEGKAEHAVAAIRKLLSNHATVLRAGEHITIDSSDLVPGDIVILEAGDKVPADVRLLEVHGLQAAEAILTGESVPVAKTTQELQTDTMISERTCIAFSGTLITHGQATGVVVATGKNTEIGHISHMLEQIGKLTTPLVQQMATFAKLLTVFILLVATALILHGHYSGHHIVSEMLVLVVAICVAAIPEGLPAVLTITLAVGVQAMARRNAIVRRLPAIETLGSISVICTDKTGTLTCNKMQVTKVVEYENTYNISGVGYAPEGDVTVNGQQVDINSLINLQDIALAASLCNDSSIYQKDNEWLVNGDPMEGALLSLAQKIMPDITTTWQRIDSIPFAAEQKFMASLNYHENNYTAFLKGAPEKILSMCTQQNKQNGETMPIDIAYWQEQVNILAGQGLRVLAVAKRGLSKPSNTLHEQDIADHLTFIGLVALIDPSRPEVVAAISACNGAGIGVKMITGDHALTASAIGRELGLPNSEQVLTGKDLDSMSDSILRQKVLECNIFARTTPKHKLRLVEALQSYNFIVAMTGDGVNDAPALKRADVGIAMGIQGSELAKEESELVLVDDNFASIVAAVQEGRTVYDNIKKVITWTLPTNAGEASILIIAILLHLQPPITAVQILWINFVTAITLGIALAFEPTESTAMQRPPRQAQQGLLSPALVWQVLFVAFLFICGAFSMYYYAISEQLSISYAHTLALNTIVVMEVFYLFYMRNIYTTALTWRLIKGTKIIWYTITGIVIAQLIITYMPWFNKVLGTAPLSLLDGMLVIGVGLILFVILEVEKQVRIRILSSLAKA